MKPRAIIICVEYDDILSMTLHRNRRHFSDCCVVTSETDDRTVDVCSQVRDVQVFRTDAFTRHGARFNKGLAMEEGLEYFGRHGWMLILDADVIIPASGIPYEDMNTECLYGARRRMLEDPRKYYHALDWSTLPLADDVEFAGFFQLFHASASVLPERWWYDPTFIHAGGGDAYFQSLWPADRKIRDNGFQLLHLGPRDVNWFGRASDRTDGRIQESVKTKTGLMQLLKLSNGWVRSPRSRFVGAFPDRICLEEYSSTYQWHESKPPE